MLSSAGVVEVVNSVLIGVFCGLFVYQQFAWSALVTVGIGAVGVLLSLAGHLRYQIQRAEYARQLFATGN